MTEQHAEVQAELRVRVTELVRDVDPHEMREFWLIFRRGGMAEWSMAVVLKT